jgi:predicted nucleotidyltransferase
VDINEMTSKRDRVLDALREWAKGFVERSGFDRIFLFGSLVYRRGTLFEPNTSSDIDIVAQFSSGFRTPVQRVAACLQALTPKKELEELLSDVLGRRRNRPPIVSIAVGTPFEIENGIHKGGDPRIYVKPDFINLAGTSIDPISLASSASITFDVLFHGAIPVIQLAQEYRSKFLAINAAGKAPVKAWGSKNDRLPKKMCRSAAQLRYFGGELSDDTEFNINVGLLHIESLIRGFESQGAPYKDLSDWLQIRVGRGEKLPLPPEGQLLLLEILAEEAARQIMRRQWRSAPTLVDISPESERRFLEVASGPSLKLGDLNLQSKLLPLDLWHADRKDHVFQDDPESVHQIVIENTQLTLPQDTLSQLMKEIEGRLKVLKSMKSDENEKELWSLEDIHKKLNFEGSNAYPRIVALPDYVPPDHSGGRQKASLRIRIGPSRYGIALVEERRLELPTAVKLRAEHVLNSLAVRVAFIFERDSENWIEFHQRLAKANATYGESWDVGAAGYVDPARHKDPEAPLRVSPWQACAFELSEELGIEQFDLPHRDHYFFFGLGRNDPTGQLDLLGYCHSAVPLNPNRDKTARVSGFGRCRFDPVSVAAFVLAKKRWVPTAVLTIILTLEAYGFPVDSIVAAFKPLVGNIDYSP